MPDPFPGIIATMQQQVGQVNPPSAPPSPPLIGPPGPGESGPTGGRLTCKYGTAPQDLSDALREFWPPELWDGALRISWRESLQWQRTAELNTLNLGPCGTRYWLPAINAYASTEDSVGYFQINLCAHGGTREYWQDARNNVRKAYELYQSDLRIAGNGWLPWAISAGREGLAPFAG